jgi:hypothetical protein
MKFTGATLGLIGTVLSVPVLGWVAGLVGLAAWLAKAYLFTEDTPVEIWLANGPFARGEEFHAHFAFKRDMATIQVKDARGKWVDRACSVYRYDTFEFLVDSDGFLFRARNTVPFPGISPFKVAPDRAVYLRANLFPIGTRAFSVLIAVLFCCGCNNPDNGGTAQGSTASAPAAQVATETTEPVHHEKTEKGLAAYHKVKKTYNGQTVYLLDIDDLPLQGVPLATLKQKANAGDPAAEYELGRRLGKGEGVTRDLQESIEWIQKAASENNPNAQFELGMMYSLGTLVKQNPCLALDFFQKAARRGHVLAKNNLAQMYEQGSEVKRDYAKALYWAKKAAEQGFSPSQNMVGLIYQQGEGIPPDKAKALEWFHKAAKQNNPEAFGNIGNIYYNGDGVPTDYVEAINKRFNILKSKMTPAQIRAGEKEVGKLNCEYGLE